MVQSSARSRRQIPRRRIRWQTGNGLFSKKRVTIEQIEGQAFESLKAWAFARRYERTGVLHDRLSQLKKRFGDSYEIPKSFKLLSRVNTSVADSISFQNKPFPSDLCFKSISDKGAVTRMNVRGLVENKDVVVKAPINFLSYLTGTPSEFAQCLSEGSTDGFVNLWDDPFFVSLIAKSPFFRNTGEFKAAVERHANMTGDYEERAQVYYEIANFYSQMVVRSIALYNVELMSYFKTLFEQSNFKGSRFTEKTSKESLLKKVDALSSSSQDLQSGEYMKRIDKAFKSAEPEKHAYLDSLLKSTLPAPAARFSGLSPAARFSGLRGGWSVPGPEKTPALKVAKLAQLLEIFLAEPYFQDKDYIDTGEPLVNSYRFSFFEPLVTKKIETEADVPKGEFAYIEDLRKKFLIALRECRKSMIMHEYFSILLDPNNRSDDDELSKLQQLCDGNDKPLSWKVDLIFSDVIEKIPQKIDTDVRSNFVNAASSLKLNSGDTKAIGKALVSPSSLVHNLPFTTAWSNLSTIRAPEFSWSRRLYA